MLGFYANIDLSNFQQIGNDESTTWTIVICRFCTLGLDTADTAYCHYQSSVYTVVISVLIKQRWFSVSVRTQVHYTAAK